MATEMNEQSQDYFSAVAATYGKYRPRYPIELFKYLAELAPDHQRAWDCGTGSGQAAIALTDFFEEVIGTDISQSQLDHAQPHPQVKYQVGKAEATEIPDQSIDLLVSAQAVHWFDIEAFYQEVRRVLKPNGVIAIWCYGLLSVNADIDVFVEELNTKILGSYWPQRTIEDHTYSNIYFPFDEFPRRNFKIEAEWTLEDLKSYFGTWSAVDRYKKQNSSDPLSLIQADLLRLWGDPHQPRQITWTLYLRHGKV